MHCLSNFGVGFSSLVQYEHFQLFFKQEDFLRDKIKVNGKTGNLGDDVDLSRDKNLIHLKSKIPFSKRFESLV